MVQYFLSCVRKINFRIRGIACGFALFLLLGNLSFAVKRSDSKSALQPPPDLLLEGGRSLTFERSFSSKKDIGGKPGFWKKLVDLVAGEAEYLPMVRPYSIAVDSRDRVIVTDPGAGGVHIFDFNGHKYRFLERKDVRKDPMLEPQCVAVDSKNDIYVTDSKAGKIFVWEASGKYRGTLGSLKGGEGFFKRPTGIAIDPETQLIYVTDTLRDKVYVLDSKGSVQRTIGKHGNGEGEFNFPTEVLIKNNILAVVDAMNFRVQIFNRDGSFQAAIGDLGDGIGTLFRPKGLAIDSEDHLYLVDGFRGMVQVFDRQGELLYTFGKRGSQLGDFQLPTGLFIDPSDRVYVVDSYNRRVQVFQYHGLKTRAEGAK
jgi:DNA-binding beta-propeller fold protein YncE